MIESAIHNVALRRLVSCEVFETACPFSGHDARKRDGALSALNMSKGYDGAQTLLMRDIIIVQAEGYLGLYSPLLKVGDIQSSYATEQSRFRSLVLDTC